MVLIFYIYKNPGTNLQQLTQKLNLSKSTVSGEIDRLICQGDVIREIPRDNRRTVKLYVSADFINKHNLEEFKNKHLGDLVKGASIEELNEIINALEKIRELIKLAQSDEHAE